MPHKITFEEMTDYINQETWTMAACSEGQGSRKRLEYSTKGMFRVTDHDDTAYQGASLGEAVDAYNAAP